MWRASKDDAAASQSLRFAAAPQVDGVGVSHGAVNDHRSVIAGLDPAIHLSKKAMDARVEPAHNTFFEGALLPDQRGDVLGHRIVQALQVVTAFERGHDATLGAFIGQIH